MADMNARTSIWKGLNRMPYIEDGEMRSMKNLCSDGWPYLTTRKGRKPYTLVTHIPSPEGEAYKSVERLPEPCVDEVGNVYRVTGSAPAADWVSGQFYYWNGAEWKEGTSVSEDYWLGSTVNVVEVDGGETLVSSNFTLGEFSESRRPSGHNNGGDYITFSTAYCEGTDNEFVWCRYRVKYRGKDTEFFKCGKTYAYCVYAKAHWVEGSWDNGNSGGSKREMPEATATLAAARYYYKYIGETTDEFTYNTIYRCVVSGRVYWEECEEQYTAVEVMPENPTEGQIVRFVDLFYGAPMKSGYYICAMDSDSSGTPIYYYVKEDSAEEYTETGYLPQASAETAEKCFYYNGVTEAGEFAECYQDGSGCDYRVVEHPQVPRTVSLKDYLDNYNGCGLSEILEIGALNGNLAVLFRDSQGAIKLYYNQKVYGEINCVTEASGKKLVTVGNKLVVGESGSYLYEKEGETVFNQRAGVFSYGLYMEKCYYGLNGKYKMPRVYGEKSSGKAVFELWSPQFYLGQNESCMFKGLAEALSIAGTGFCVYGQRNNSRQYLEVVSVEYNPQKLLIGYSNGYKEEYAEYLRIEATGVLEDFEWDFSVYDILTFESTDPHYYDVVSWKKRLWAYKDNVMYGTAADIFDDNGLVDWNRGDNTNMEAIAQPLWQGGNITGIAALMSGLVYFKDEFITVVQGNYPAIMSSNTIPCRGLPPENRRSVAVINESVYYLSTDGVYRFDGALPRCISRNVKIRGTDAVGAGDGNKYYLSIKEESGEYALYVYDINRGIWHREDDTHAVSFVMLNGELHMAVGTEVYAIGAKQEDVSWECELWFDEGTHRPKKYKSFSIRGDVGRDCEMYLKADDGEWELAHSCDNKLDVKIAPFDAEELSVKLCGKGICEIKSMDRIYEVR